ncbi:MAG: hypothetical protein WAO98_09080 [Alphaproteobacteria bacterium]
MADQNIKLELNAVIVAVTGHDPQILIDPNMALPSGPFETGHRTLEQGLRAWAKSKGGQPLGYVEQLYTFADKDRAAGQDRFVSIGYLALVRPAATPSNAIWSPWYKHFPWEDHRKGVPAIISKVIMPGLTVWKSDVTDAAIKRERNQRIAIAFPKDMKNWNEELVLQRYELLWEAGLVDEAQSKNKKSTTLGTSMAHDHRRILATAIARLRAKIKYRPVVFELMPDSFTLLQLQSAVEALAGLRLHKQNFRRLVEGQGLVEETGAMTQGMGRPAKLFAFRRDVLVERAAAGTKLPRS